MPHRNKLQVDLRLIYVHLVPSRRGPWQAHVNAVSARDLHEKLGVKTKVTDWIKRRIEESILVEGEDYILVSQNRETRSGGTVVHDYHLTLDAAKHIAMLERTEIGKAIRQYLIDIEELAALAAQGNPQLKAQEELTAYTTVPLPSGGSIVAAVKDGECFFSPRHVCEEMGIAWNSQFTKIKADPVLSTSVMEIITQLPGTTQARTYTMLPLSMLSGWLFTIKKVAPAIQGKLNLYRAEGFLALDAWFRQGLRQDQEVQQKIKVPQTLAEALELAAAQARENERLEAERDEALAAKAEVDAVVSEHLLSLTVDEWAALNGQYLNRSEAGRLAYRGAEKTGVESEAGSCFGPTSPGYGL